MADGFLGRWSRRKAGVDVDAPQEKKIEAPKEPSQDLPAEKIAEEASPLPTLDDVAKIDRFDPDFSAFMKPDVDPAVQQAALKKMFTDPHFNIMDGLDIYIDDYSKLDPLPPGMLERMTQSDMLNLFRKSADLASSDSEQNESRLTEPQAQSALPSTEQKTSAQLGEVTDAVPIEPEQKKT
ncbi:DUF3306 domain-containing protein [Polynucleobacter sp. MWH-Braz-FAM2G]|uniref:DUF3306 domain-containing protein n=1 Tax=Polynucleobacter sp. MWH-Braz-FAM2G TaxID=1855883 RepID=UPI001BFDE710|nr:DUF3306 domain-containing protein [Polynucleobacter sp. MWH-Braz-FAM2G]QWD91341.1 DUF3306 domain-containing protein [Polynucleobacter sp. MWH-Braz-FAM2G]